MQSIKLRKTCYAALLLAMLLCMLLSFVGTSAQAAQSGNEGRLKGKIAAGAAHSLALKSDGTLIAWGSNSQGQTSVPAGLNGVVAIAAGDFHSLALKSDGTVVAWGYNAYHQTDIPSGLNDVVSIAAGTNDSMALKSDGTVVAWGDNGYGQTDVPAGLNGVISIAAGFNHQLALKSDGTVVAWGFNIQGQTSVPAGLNGVVSIAAGGYHSLALKSDGTVVAWGYNGYHQTDIPSGLNDVVSITAGIYHSMALKSDGKVVAWGMNSNNQTDVPAGLNDVMSIASGWSHSMALKSDGTIVAWGNNNNGQMNVPEDLQLFVKGRMIDAGGWHLLALKTDGTVAAWGDNIYGQGNIPVGLNDVKSIAAGDLHSLALKTDGTVVAWGYNGNRQTNVPLGLNGVVSIAAGGYTSLVLKTDGTVAAWGDNTTGQNNVPPGLNGVKSIAVGVSHMLALKTDGTIVAWGDNVYGQSNVPPGLDHVKSIAAGSNYSAALKTDGTVAVWGDNTYDIRNTPAGLNGVAAITAGKNHLLALKADGTVVAWGENNADQVSVPAGLNGVTGIAAGGYSSLALKADGTVIAWGGYPTVPGSADLNGLTLQEGSFNPPFQSTVTAYTYSYIGASASSVHVTATFADSSLSALYVNNQLKSSGNATIVNVTGASTEIPVRVEPYFLPGRSYTITIVRDSASPDVQFSVNGNASSTKSAATRVTVTDTESGVDPVSLQYVWMQGSAVPVSGWTSFLNGQELIQSSGDGNWYLHIQAKDKAGNLIHQVTHLFILDNTVPDLILNGSNPMYVPIGQSYVEPGVTVTDNIDGNIHSSSIIKTGIVNTAIPGSYPVMYHVTDHAGNTARVTRNVYVYDGPVIQLNGPNPMTVEVNSSYTDPGATAMDFQGGALVPIITGAVHTRELGTYSLVYNATDHLNHTAPTVTRYVYVKDTKPPVLSLLGDHLWVIGVGGSFHDPGARAQDEYESDVSSLINVTGIVDTSRIGKYNIDYNVADSSHNSALTVTRYVYVIAQPVIRLLGQSTMNLMVGDTFMDPGAQANDTYYGDLSNRIAVTGAVNMQATGTYTVRYNVQDPAGIAAVEVTRTVIVEPLNVTVEPDNPIRRGSSLSGNVDLKVIKFLVDGKELSVSLEGAVETINEIIEVQVEAADSRSIVTLQGETLEGSKQIQLSEGDNVVVIMVKAPNGSAKSYSYTIHRTVPEKTTVSENTTAMSCIFTDIGGHWAAAEICEAASAGIVQGDSDHRMRPNEAVTRAEFITLLIRTLQGSSTELTPITFTDKADIPNWAQQAIQYGVSHGIINGYSDGTFLPQNTMNRMEMAVLITKALKWPIELAGDTSFGDDSNIPAWAKPYIHAGVQQGLLQGREDNRFMPNDKTTRAEAVTILLRVKKALHP
ncbi:DUF5011 domain-containing protein [Paenibacillus sp. WQ 127069]|uniref:DUF5011 domain-containing protein n=1 Tax=Paenibacillus baimaensis TaxID=2982185 RepID=A0ABT2UT97_9BACL|nr:immunoglobulin-like domain-containing protein [Paenibacillus sp. WQ 127069]MCU6797875.1 DUF5011 domain-containing protein [Paenibacillus sp. WQ 127069]